MKNFLIQNKENSAGQYLIYKGKKHKPKFGFLFWFGVVRFLVNLFSLIDKYAPKIVSFFENDL